jgi:hypothetical protein
MNIASIVKRLAISHSVMRSLMDMRSLLYNSVQRAKHKLSQHIGQLSFTPTASGRWFRCEWRLQAAA